MRLRKQTQTLQLKIALVGAGALGSALCRHFGRAGCPNVLLLDPGRLETRNLAMSPLLRQALRRSEKRDRLSDGLEAEPYQAEPYKVELLSAHAREVWGLPWQAMPVEFADVGLQRLAEIDVLCCAADNTLVRAEIAFVARLLAKPVLDGGVLGEAFTGGRVTWFPPQEQAACYLCGMTEDRRAQVLGYAASASLGCAPLQDAPPMSGTPATVRQTAAAMWHQLGRFANSEVAPGRAVAWRLEPCAGSGSWQAQPVTLQKSASCPWHGPSAGTLLPVEWDLPLKKTLRRKGFSTVDLLWPLCTEARCHECGRYAEPMACPEPLPRTGSSMQWQVVSRLALVRRQLRCPHCGMTGSLEPLRCVDRIGSGDVLSEMSPRQLGLPDRHLLLFR